MQVTPALRRLLEPSELVDATRACPICLSAAPRRAVFRVQRDPDVHMLACPRCRAASASHMPRADVLESYYASYYSGREREITFSDPARFARHVVKSLPRVAVRSILDFGGGDGSLARAVAELLLSSGRAAEVEVLVIDYHSSPQVADGRIRVRFQLPSAAVEGQYDLVLASAILEHIPELHRVFAMLHAAMAPRAFFYARTPYVLPLTKLYGRLDLTYPAHVHDMGSPFWNRMPETLGWNVRALASRPSLVAGSLTGDPLRAIAAAVAKVPAYVETWLSPRARKARLWHFVGGWEVLFQRA
jgi:Methyltransferase domain